MKKKFLIARTIFGSMSQSIPDGGTILDFISL